MLRFTAFISFPLMFGLALIAPEFITIAITDKWLPSAAIMQILCIWGAFLPINYIYTNQLISKGKSNVYMWNTIIQNLVQLLVLLLTVSYGIYVMAAIYVTINILWLFVWHYFVWQLIRITLWNVMKDITPYLSITAISLTAGYFAAKAFSNIYICLINKIVVTALVYIIILWSSKSVIFHESINFLLKRRK